MYPNPSTETDAKYQYIYRMNSKSGSIVFIKYVQYIKILAIINYSTLLERHCASKFRIICKLKWCFAKDIMKSSHREVWLLS